MAGITASVSGANQITASVGESKIDVAVSGGVGPTGSSGIIAVSAPITNTGTTTSANIGLSVGAGLEVAGGSLAVTYGSTSSSACAGNDARLSDSREWSAATVTQAEAEAGVATDRKAFTVLRVWQAIAAWWAGSAAKTKLDGIAAGATANQTDAYLLSRSNHTGTQTASTISDFTSAVVAAAPPTTDASLLTTGTLPDQRLSANIARTSDVSSAISSLVDSAPGALDTLNELAAALGDDANFSTTVTNALAAKAPLASPNFTGTVSGITKSMVGLGNVDNTSDANKPVSTATQTALDGKAASSHSHNASDINAGTLSASRLPIAAAGTLGAVRIGSGISIDGDGIISASAGYTLPTATNSVLGGVKIGSGVTITDGVISVSTNYAAASHTHDASAITAGTLNASRLPSNVVTTTTISGAQHITSGVAAIATEHPALTGGANPGGLVLLNLSYDAGSVFAVAADGNATLYGTGAFVCHAITLNNSDLATTLSGKADAADIRYKGEWSAGEYDQGDIVYKSAAAGSEVSGYIGTLWVCTDLSTSDEPDGTTAAWTRFKAVAESHAHSASDITSGTIDTARLAASGTASNTTFLRGDQTWASAGSTSASDLTSGTLADARLSAKAQAAIDLYLWSAFR